MSDFYKDLMREYIRGVAFLGRRGDEAAGPAPLRAVTAGNAHEFTHAPRRRGRPAKVSIGGNVVAFRPRPAAEPNAQERAVDEVCRRFGKFVDRLEANAAKKAERRKLAQKPAPALEVNPPTNPVDEWFRAGCAAFLALPIGGGKANSPGDGPKGAA